MTKRVNPNGRRVSFGFFVECRRVDERDSGTPTEGAKRRREER